MEERRASPENSVGGLGWTELLSCGVEETWWWTLERNQTKTSLLDLASLEDRTAGRRLPRLL
jgi:hypothetical protein